VTLRSYVRRLAVGKNKPGSNAVSFGAWTAMDVPGHIASGTVFMGGEPRLGFVGDRQHQRRIMATFAARICANQD
jgi:hypothetical protein